MTCPFPPHLLPVLPLCPSYPAVNLSSPAPAPVLPLHPFCKARASWTNLTSRFFSPYSPTSTSQRRERSTPGDSTFAHSWSLLGNSSWGAWTLCLSHSSEQPVHVAPTFPSSIQGPCFSLPRVLNFPPPYAPHLHTMHVFPCLNPCLSYCLSLFPIFKVEVKFT